MRAGVQVPAGQFHVLRAQRVEDIGDCQVVGAQAVGVHQHMDLAPRAADDGDFAHALRVLEFLLDLLVGDHGHVAQRARRGDGDLQNGRGVGIELLHHRLFGGLRQIGNDQIHLVLNFLRRHIAVLRQLEADDNQRLAFRRNRAQFVDPLMVLTASSTFLVISVSISSGEAPGIRNNYGNGWNIDLRKQIDTEAKE